MSREKAKELIEQIYKSPTTFHAVDNCKNILTQSGFAELKLAEAWELQKGGKYFLTQNGSSLFAFKVGEKCDDIKYKIVGSHTDAPGLKIKPNPEMLAEGYLKINTEIYGGPILSTWFDRPLALAGRVFVKTDSPMEPECRLVNINKPIAILPNIAIHMNRQVNSGVAFDNQKDILPLLKTVETKFEKKNYLLNLISKEVSVDINDILDFDLYFYEYEKGIIFGLENEFISTGRIDDLQAVYAGIDAMISAKESDDSINVLACFDNEEVGSSSKQGADSQLLSNILERIAISLSGGSGREEFLRSISKSFMISLDGAHAAHPNKPEKCDPTSRPVINSGPVVKISANQKYTSDAHSISIYRCISEKAEIPYQVFVNHSNEKGGSTIGPINSTHLEIKSIDVGMPMFAMHSIREMCGVKDHADFIKVLKTFYEI
jgi:aspartyl aminopeptidase